MMHAKTDRNIRRENGEPEEILVRESQFMKAELRRLKQRLGEELEGLRKIVSQH